MINRKKIVLDGFDLLNNCQAKNYLFRTRLERCLVKTKTYGKRYSLSEIIKQAKNLENKLLYICDSSNVTSSGNARSFEILKDDINILKHLIKQT